MFYFRAMGGVEVRYVDVMEFLLGKKLIYNININICRRRGRHNKAKVSNLFEICRYFD